MKSTKQGTKDPKKSLASFLLAPCTLRLSALHFRIHRVKSLARLLFPELFVDDFAVPGKQAAGDDFVFGVDVQPAFLVDEQGE